MNNQVGLQGWFPQNIERFHRSVQVFPTISDHLMIAKKLME